MSGRRFLCLQWLAGALVSIAVCWLLCLAAIVYWSRGTDTGQADAIVVLGAAQYDGRPSPVLRARLDHALDLWSDHRARLIVLTGGQRQGDKSSEAAAGRRYLIQRGVPGQAIKLESVGRTSLASISGAAMLLSAMHDSLTADSPEVRETESPIRARRPRVLLVSDPFHMLRLDVLARLHGLEPLPSPTRTSPISANRTVIEYMLRESIAVPADIVLMVWLRISGRHQVN